MARALKNSRTGCSTPEPGGGNSDRASGSSETASESVDPHAIATGLSRVHEVWVDEHCLDYGKSVPEQIAAAIKEADYVVACVSDAYAASTFCQREYNFAENMNKLIIPVIVGKEDCNNWTESWVGFMMSHYYYINATKMDIEVLVAKLINKIDQGTPERTDQSAPVETNSTPSPIPTTPIDTSLIQRQTIHSNSTRIPIERPARTSPVGRQAAPSTSARTSPVDRHAVIGREKSIKKARPESKTDKKHWK
ncbi:hypothetical protein HDV00_003566 [Rhizophlyctis rosea]|nr:hypothetical protein HDV00_003566 [Rhizophlyctis rosea]